MSNKFILILLFLVISTTGFAQKKVVFIILDGIPADVLEKVATPHLDEIAKIGGYSRAYTGGIKGGYSETPTISAVGYNSLITGTWANKHNVWDNDIVAPNYHYWTIFKMLKNARPASTIGVFSTWQDNRTKLIGAGLAETGIKALDYAFDSFELDTLSYPHDLGKKYIQKIDNLVSFEAAYQLKTNAPDLSWVYLEYTDDMGHQFGDSPELHAAVELADTQVGRIFDSIKYREEMFGEEWLVLVTTDHGRKASDGKDHGGQSDRERETWIVTNAKNLNDYFKNEKPAVVDLLPSMLRHLDLEIPKSNAGELDGVSLIGAIDFSGLELIEDSGELVLNWKSYVKEGEVELYLSTSNNYQQGLPDRYELIGTVSTINQSFQLPKKYKELDFFKLMLVSPAQTAGIWWSPNKK